MNPAVLCILATLRDDPGLIAPEVASAAADTAMRYIDRLEQALLGIKRASENGSYVYLTADAVLREGGF